MKVRLEFKPQDLWIGAYWERRNFHLAGNEESQWVSSEMNVWICLVPMIPIHLTWTINESEI